MAACHHHNARCLHCGQIIMHAMTPSNLQAMPCSALTLTSCSLPAAAAARRAAAANAAYQQPVTTQPGNFEYTRSPSPPATRSPIAQSPLRSPTQVRHQLLQHVEHACVGSDARQACLHKCGTSLGPDCSSRSLCISLGVMPNRCLACCQPQSCSRRWYPPSRLCSTPMPSFR